MPAEPRRRGGGIPSAPIRGSRRGAPPSGGGGGERGLFPPEAQGSRRGGVLRPLVALRPAVRRGRGAGPPRPQPRDRVGETGVWGRSGPGCGAASGIWWENIVKILPALGILRSLKNCFCDSFWQLTIKKFPLSHLVSGCSWIRCATEDSNVTNAFRRDDD
ncbi:uncharacterized protein LOC121233749 isoform X2 [Aquila chrysaetos chrysaetos]|uniref:uncharacterized protein LOC121233749 isoform X2 n=1 Tax=Aquila chrysaetos chrysaetos TaxID=223781 RepID=UPI001B7D2F75|nr:uncharacterized protein LOC121233749 isoform X2 [Aquila chrysaetos chrysaetos]